MDEEEELTVLDSYRNSTKFWEELFDCVVIKIHTCKKLPADNSSKIFKCKIEDQKASLWYFANVRLATNYDVEAGEAEYLAEVQSASTINICFCPFCGKELT